MSMHFDTSLVLLDDESTSPEAAIAVAGNLLVAQRCATSAYVDAMLEAYHQLGPYIVLAPHVAMPHARPEFGGLANGIALVRLKRPVEFGHPDNDPVRLIIPLVGNDDGSHIHMLQRVAVVLSDPQAVDIINESDDPLEIVELFIPPEE